MAVFMTILLMSLAGLPPTAGFLAKYRVFILSISQGYLAISIFAIVMAIIGVYYYFYVLRETFSESDNPNPIEISRLNSLLIVVCGVAVLLLGIFVWSVPI